MILKCEWIKKSKGKTLRDKNIIKGLKFEFHQHEIQTI